jgi:hypothetical protein
MLGIFLESSYLLEGFLDSQNGGGILQALLAYFFPKL